MALGLNCELAKAHSVMGDVQLWRHQHKKSVNSGSQAVECDPSHADSRMVYAYCLAMNGDGNGALRQAKLALRHNPLRANRIYYSALGHACFLTRDYEGARKASIEGIRRDSNHHGLRLLLAASLTRLGELEAAQKEISAALGIEPDLRRGNLGRLWPYRSGDDLDRFVEALADCGLPA